MAAKHKARRRSKSKGPNKGSGATGRQPISPQDYADMLQRIFDWFQFEPQMGDVNENGSVDIIDVLWIVNILLGTHQATPGQAWAADVNEDGSINIIDAITLVNIILGG